MESGTDGFYVLKNTAYLPNFVKILFCNLEENIKKCISVFL